MSPTSRADPPHVVVFEHGDNLVIGLGPVDHLQPTDHARPDNDLVACDRAFAKDADVQRITITAIRFGREPSDSVVAVRARDESVQTRGLR